MGQRCGYRGARGSGKKLTEDSRLRLLFELARSSLHMPVGEMLDRMSYFELNHWLLLQVMDPAGEQRADLRQAIGTAAFVNTQVTNKKDSKEPKDYMASEWLKKAWHKSAVNRGVRKAFDGKSFWQRFRKLTQG
jgi:hypothetical protein